MKKTLRLTLLAVAAVALLTSCNEMLAALFPIETGHGTGAANNSLTVNVTGYNNYNYSNLKGGWAYYNYGYTYGGKPIYLDLTDPNGNTTTYSINTGFNGTDPKTATFATITGLAEGNYTFKVWYDVDGDGTYTLESNSTFNGWYYTNQGYYSGNYVTQVSLSGGTSATVDTYLYDYPDLY